MDETLGKTFGERMRKTREGLYISQEQLAKVLNTGKSSISKWESGVNPPKLKQALAICNALNVSFEYLVGLYNDEEEGLHIKANALWRLLTVEEKRNTLKYMDYLIKHRDAENV